MISPSSFMVAGFDRGNGENEIIIWSGRAKDGHLPSHFFYQQFQFSKFDWMWLENS
jgi:hypothetical protein